MESGETAEKGDLIFVVPKMATHIMTQTDLSITELSTLHKSNFLCPATNEEGYCKN